MVQQLIDTGVGFVAAIDEVDYDHVKLLPVTMAAADALLDPLGVPRQIEVDDKRAELKVDAFSASLGSNHHCAALFEMLNKGCTGVGRARARDLVGALVALDPVRVDSLGTGIVVRAVEQHDAFTVRCLL